MQFLHLSLLHKFSCGDASMRTGLFSPDDFRDNCGFGLIAHETGQASHRLLETAIESLTCMTHRGGIASDGKTCLLYTSPSPRDA